MKGYTITDIGKVRSENQDCVRFIQNSLPSYGVLALCDGMGGAKAGSVASNIALTSFTTHVTDYLSDKKNKDDILELVRAAVEQANKCVYDRGTTDTACEGMGTTLVAAVVKGKDCCIANVGDSRAYLISGGEILQITRDHSFVEEMVGRGSITREQARTHPRRNLITRALGVDESVVCDIFTPEFKKNDLLLLCSDGLSNTLSDKEILDVAVGNKNLSDIAKELLDLALLRGAPDNVTVGLLRK
ncbi:MAG: Stp1/IreP family PP2C-type Ser/Thr phosphatase [Clostridiales bacterium]|jgi:serine/threonine protein phosphatase PrpC|nr:Stp1/IreP family PP2C-type Ser/Thr phosphatase [Clostridiales bacterium]